MKTKLSAPRADLAKGGLRFVAILALLALLAACATGPRVRTDYDPAANFSQYQTWGFYSPIEMDDVGYSSWVSERIREGVRREMEARGYRYVEENPDLQVNFRSGVQERTDVWSTPSFGYPYFYGYPYAYRYPAYYPFPYWYDNTQVVRYTEGTLTVDLVDVARNRMVWTGAAVDRIRRAPPQERLAEIDQAVAAIFSAFPYRAGTSAPVAAKN